MYTFRLVHRFSCAGHAVLIGQICLEFCLGRVTFCAIWWSPCKRFGTAASILIKPRMVQRLGGQRTVSAALMTLGSLRKSPIADDVQRTARATLRIEWAGFTAPLYTASSSRRIRATRLMLFVAWDSDAARTHTRTENLSGAGRA